MQRCRRLPDAVYDDPAGDEDEKGTDQKAALRLEDPTGLRSGLWGCGYEPDHHDDHGGSEIVKEPLINSSIRLPSAIAQTH